MDSNVLANIFGGSLPESREYGDEVTEKEEARLKENNYVIIFGYSDDNVELRGAIDDELGAWGGTELFFYNGKLLTNECEEDECPYFEEVKKIAKNLGNVIEATYSPWTFKTSIPHKKFKIMEDGEEYGEAIIISLNDIK